MKPENDNNTPLRRNFLSSILDVGFMVVTGGWSLQACGKPGKSQEAEQTVYVGAPCQNLHSVSETELAKRNNFGYVDQSPIDDNQCNNCNLYLPPKGDSPCGECILFKGPVEEKGYCTYWAPKA